MLSLFMPNIAFSYCYTECHCPECYYTKCRYAESCSAAEVKSIFQSVIMLNDVMLSVVAPLLSSM